MSQKQKKICISKNELCYQIGILKLAVYTFWFKKDCFHSLIFSAKPFWIDCSNYSETYDICGGIVCYFYTKLGLFEKKVFPQLLKSHVLGA